MKYLLVRTREPVADPPVPENRVADLVLVLLHDMATMRTLGLGEVAVRRRMNELGVTEADCDTLSGNIAQIAIHGPKSKEDREILSFYFAIGLRGKLVGVLPEKRQRLLAHIRETLDFLSVVFGPRCLNQIAMLDGEERQILWDLVGSTVLAVGREQEVPGVESSGALLRWCGLFAAAPREDRRVLARAVLAHGLTAPARLALVALLDPMADADLLPMPTDPGVAARQPLPQLVTPPDAEAGAPGERPSSRGDAAVETPIEVRGRVIHVRGAFRRFVARVTAWALVGPCLRGVGRVLLGLRREGRIQVTHVGMVYDETLWMLGRPILARTIAVPLAGAAPRLDRRNRLVPLLIGTVAAGACVFVGVLWLLDGLGAGYWPLLVAAGALICLGLAIDLLAWRIAGRLRGRCELVFDGGSGARVRLLGVDQAQAEAVLAALAGPSPGAAVRS